MKVKLNNADLTHMLNTTKRIQTVNGKKQSQVESCAIRIINENMASITSLTRDMTGLTTVSTSCESENVDGMIPIPDIDRVLGILKMHSDSLTLEWKPADSKLVFKSSGKRTTLDASLGAKAFMHSQDTIEEFANTSLSLVERIDHDKGIYHANNGQDYEAFCSFLVNANHLYDACRCDTINGQRLNRYSFSFGVNPQEQSMFTVEVGDPSLGQTLSEVVVESTFKHTEDFTWTFDGGLDELFKQFGGMVKLNFFDFREHGQGIRFSATFGDAENNNWAWQAGVLG